MNPDNLVKIQFYDADVGYENLWATPVGSDRYKLESIPFFIYGVSLGDIVQAQPDPDGKIVFVQVVHRSGSKTLRARPDAFTLAEPKGSDLVKRLKALGCGVELLQPRLVAIDVPGTLDIQTATEVLTSEAVPWEYADPTLDEINRGESVQR